MVGAFFAISVNGFALTYIDAKKVSDSVEWTFSLYGLQKLVCLGGVCLAGLCLTQRRIARYARIGVENKTALNRCRFLCGECALFTASRDMA